MKPRRQCPRAALLNASTNNRTAAGARIQREILGSHSMIMAMIGSILLSSPGVRARHNRKPEIRQDRGAAVAAQHRASACGFTLLLRMMGPWRRARSRKRPARGRMAPGGGIGITWQTWTKAARAALRWPR